MAGSLFLGRKLKIAEANDGKKSEKICMISPFDISPNPSQPRKYFTDDAILRTVLKLTVLFNRLQ